MDTQLIGQTLGSYLLRRNIGIGGMGRVYQGIDMSKGRPVAVKVLLPEYAQDEFFRTRFLREAELMRTLRHPHIVEVYDFGEWQGFLYFVMQLVQGPSLERILLHHRFSPLTAWQIVHPLAIALGYGHSLHVLHRDLKTANVLLERKGEGNHVYLTDFGLGKRPGLDTTLTAAGVSVGTPEYMAPEVAMGAPADQRSDLYSLGVILFELLLGRLPFLGANPQMTALAHVDQPVPRARDLNPAFPRRLESILLKALAKDPQARYPDAEAIRLAYYEAVKAMSEDERRKCYWPEG